MQVDDLTLQYSTFTGSKDNKPRFRAKDWPGLVKALLVHTERDDKDGPLWSPTVYKGKATRGNAGVESITAAVGDFDRGATYDEVKERFSQYEHVTHSTYSHSEFLPKFRVIIPFPQPVPVNDWPDLKARIDEHLFGFANDPATKDPARIFYMPSCPKNGERFALHHEGELLDPYTLPPSNHYTPKNGSKPAEHTEPAGTMKVQLGREALDFVANGAPMGEQRLRALAATRNYLSAGYSIEDTAAAIWRGLQASPQDADRGPWTYDDALFMAKNLDTADAPSLGLVDGPVPPRCEIRRSLMGYICVFPALGVTITIDHIHRRSDGLKGEITIEATVPGVPRGLHWGNFNLSSFTTRKGLASYLEDRAKGTPLGDDNVWKGILEDFCRKIALAEREGEPPVDVGDLPEEDSPTWLVENAILNKEIGTVYGPGTTGKSRFGLALGLSVKTGVEFVPGFKPVETGEVYYLDWETERMMINKRIKQLCRGRETDFVRIKYLKCRQPFVEMHERIMKDIEKFNVKLVILDSVEAATTGTRDSGADQNAAVMLLYEALRKLNTTVLLIDHVNSAQAGQTKGVRKPYGSIFKYNYARYAFELRQATEDRLPGEEHLALYCTKYNDGIRPEPAGIRVQFTPTSTVYSSETIGATELTDGLSQVMQIVNVLQRGPLSTKEISEFSGLSENTIRAVISRNKDLFAKLGEGKNTRWTGNQAARQIAAEHETESPPWDSD